MRRPRRQQIRVIVVLLLTGEDRNGRREDERGGHVGSSHQFRLPISQSSTSLRTDQERTRFLPSTQPLSHALTPEPPLRRPANSSMPFGSYPIVMSGSSSASDACSQMAMDAAVGEDGV